MVSRYEAEKHYELQNLVPHSNALVTGKSTRQQQIEGTPNRISL